MSTESIVGGEALTAVASKAAGSNVKKKAIVAVLLVILLIAILTQPNDDSAEVAEPTVALKPSGDLPPTVKPEEDHADHDVAFHIQHRRTAHAAVDMLRIQHHSNHTHLHRLM